MNEKDKVLVGEITSAHGIQGMVKVYPYTDSPERLAEIKRIYLAEEDILRKITSSRVQKTMVLMKIEGVHSRNDAERLLKKKIFIPLEDRQKLEEGQYFIDDLIGLDIFDPSSEKIGKLKDVLTQHGNDILVIQGNSGEYLVPFVKAFIEKIDENGIVIKPIEGLIP